MKDTGEFCRMNILLIGNGFDLAHGLPTKYTDFLKFIEVIKQIIDVDSKESLDQINWMNIHPEVKKKLLFNMGNIRDNLFSQKKMWKELIDNNFWIEYFSQCKTYQRENWIDFENEISYVIQQIDQDMNIVPLSGIKPGFNGEVNGLSNDYLNELYSQNVFVFQSSDKNVCENKSITFKDIRDRLYSDLNKFIRAFEIYLTDYVEKIDCNIISPDLKEILIAEKNSKEVLGCKILSFNYTNTCQRICLGKLNIDLKRHIDYIHGKADINNTIESNNMVLGIDEYLSEDRRNKDVEFIAFKKFYQRIYKGTGCEYKRWVDQIRRNENIDHELYIFGHSLNVTDGDVLRDLIMNDNVYTTIYYYNKDVMGQQIANLVKVIGQDELIKRTGGRTKTIEFKQQQNMIIRYMV